MDHSRVDCIFKWVLNTGVDVSQRFTTFHDVSRCFTTFHDVSVLAVKLARFWCRRVSQTCQVRMSQTR